MERHVRETCPKGKRRGRKRANPRRKRLADSPHLRFVENKWFNRSLALGLAIVLIIGLVVVWPKPPTRLEIGQPAPVITWDDGSLSEFGGLVMLIHFYDPNSSESIQQMPVLIQLYKTYVLDAAERGDEFFVEFISVNTNTVPPRNTEDELFQFKADWGAIWQFLLDNGAARQKYFIRDVPVSIVLDKFHNVRFILEGYQPYSVLNSAIIKALRM